MEGKYVPSELLGQGTFGKVYKARNSVTGEVVALKMTQLHEDEEEGIPPTTLREVSILRTLNNPHVVKLKDVGHFERHVRGICLQELTLIFEYMDHDLRKYMDSLVLRGRGLPRDTARSFCYQILVGLQHCHANSIMHRDLKPQNILVSNDGCVKLADFGLGRVFTAPEGAYTQEIVTLWYRSPEVLLGTKRYSTAVDLWSVGCVLGEMILGQPLFRGRSEIEQLIRIFDFRGTPTEETWPEHAQLPNWHPFPQFRARNPRREFPQLDEDCADLLERLLTLNPRKRINARAALEHRFFNGVRRREGAAFVPPAGDE